MAGKYSKRIEKCLGFSDKFKWQYLNGGKIKAKNLASKFNCLVAEVVSVTWIVTSVCKGLIVKSCSTPSNAQKN
jgi:hypothetical protein